MNVRETIKKLISVDILNSKRLSQMMWLSDNYVSQAMTNRDINETKVEKILSSELKITREIDSHIIELKITPKNDN